MFHFLKEDALISDLMKLFVILIIQVFLIFLNVALEEKLRLPEQFFGHRIQTSHLRLFS